ncbi:MAG: head GIN domain-containing protein [Bacteroidota bacterium]|nr:head GIN domain-containing protein [Bacteroidota bacterium]
MKYLFIFLLTALAIRSTAQTEFNDKNAEVRSVGSFTGIKVSGGIEVFLSQSNEYALAVSASEDEYRDAMKTIVRNGVLTISYEGGHSRFNNNRKLRAYISFKTLESLEASGACYILVNGTLKANSFKLKLSGACDIKGNVNIDNLSIELSGASNVKVNGTLQNLKISASGASDVKNYDLVTDNCEADLSGASDVRITINKSVAAKASGASSLYYKGNPERKIINASGASSISQRN